MIWICLSPEDWGSASRNRTVENKWSESEKKLFIYTYMHICTWLRFKTAEKSFDHRRNDDIANIGN